MEMTAKLWNPSAGGGGDWRSGAIARAPQILTFVLALAVAAQLALILVGLTGRSRQASPPVAALPPALPALDVGGLINSHLFGNAAAQATGDAANAPATSMPLVLTGLFATENPMEGMAIIGESAQAAKFVMVGQQVPGGAQLHSVYDDRAIIDRGGALESVFLPKSTGAPLAMGAPPPAQPEGNDAMVERMRQMVNNDPGLITNLMRPQAVFAGGKMRGFRVYPGSNRQAFARMGLRPGDLVTAINGTPLDDKDRAQEIFNTLSSSTDARVSVTRNGRQQELVLNLAQVAAEAEQASGNATPDGNIPPDQGATEQNPGNEQ
jgi:general secretion pathway protein C